MDMPIKTAAPLAESTVESLLNGLVGEQAFVFLETTKVTREEHRSYLFVKPVRRLVCRSGLEAGEFMAAVQDWLRRGYYLAGWIGYEFGYFLEPSLAVRRLTGHADRPLAEFFAFEKPHIVDHSATDGTEADAVFQAGAQRLAGDHPRYALGNLRLSMTEAEYLDAFARIKSYITGGDTYQVNFTLKYRFDFTGSTTGFYTTLRRNQAVSYGAFLKSGPRRILSFSPELFFRKRQDSITVRPMKGTIGRGRTLPEDAGRIEYLTRDMKTRSENVMIVDLLRNDLGRLPHLQVPGGVRVQSLFDIETFATLHQMTSTVTGNLTENGGAALTVAELFRALFPCGSVTGAPKIRTMEIINELEREERGVYTGAIGFFSPDGDAVFNVPIRTVVLEGGQGEMGIGSGIVSDSDGNNEWEECKLKAHFLIRPAPDFQLIETLLWRLPDGYWLLDLHLDRLEQSARYFLYPMDRRDIAGQLQHHAAKLQKAATPHRVRLTLAGDGAVEIVDTELAVAEATTQLPKVIFSGQRTDSENPYYFHKTTRRDLYDRERAKAVRDGFYEVLFCNERGEVTEGAVTNIFIRKGDIFYTPPVACGLLAGIFRRHFLTVHGDQVQEKILMRQDLEQADALYVANSVRGLVQVTLG
jgi:para-aminobenzoate synthetase/4-amino-4-deoxychorismate lyase